jgi:hypothetical protein
VHHQPVCVCVQGVLVASMHVVCVVRGVHAHVSAHASRVCGGGKPTRAQDAALQCTPVLAEQLVELARRQRHVRARHRVLRACEARVACVQGADA